ncbi:MAG: hypothetical protein AB7F19_06050 [Candidatus Babeliales bacterium]
MRILINSLLKLTLLALIISVGSVTAMEYGDLPQSNAAPTIGSWAYAFMQPSTPAKSVKATNKALYAAPVAAAAPALLSKKTMLILAGGLLTLWAVKKVYNWMYSKPKNGEVTCYQ